MNVWSQIVDAYANPKKLKCVKERKQHPYLTEKKCRTCGIVKPRSEFYTRPDRSINALKSDCKECCKAAQKVRDARAKEGKKA